MMGTPKIHDLKCWPQFFQQIENGTKTFEVRQNNRDYRPGDILVLRQFVPDDNDPDGREQGYTNHFLVCWVTSFLSKEELPWLNDLVIMGIRVLR